MKKVFLIFLGSAMMISCSQHPSSGNSTTVSGALKKPADKIWLGTWERRQWSEGATLQITGTRSDSIVFTLQAVNGAHGGEMEGTAIVEGNRATCYKVGENDTCLIVFTLAGDTAITVEQKKGMCYAGMGVTYEGEYKNSKLLPSEKEENLLSLGIFKTEKQDSLFRSLSGEHYPSFVYSTQTTSEEEDLDGFNAKVYWSGVVGLHTIHENIIMIDSLDHIWAAVLDGEKVYYFTNDDEYRAKIPKTVENWRERFKEYPVVYK